MAEPVSSTAGAALGTKFALSTGFGAALAAIVVMVMTLPKTKREWAVALCTTLAFSVFGGASVIQYFGLADWTIESQNFVSFASGLPGWIAVRSFFAWSESEKGRTIIQLITEIRKAWKVGKDAE